MLTRLRSVATGDVLTVANIHVAYDKFERPDRQCLQVVTVCVYFYFVKFDGFIDSVKNSYFLLTLHL